MKRKRVIAFAISLVIICISVTGYCARYGAFEGIIQTQDQIYINNELIPQAGTDSNGNPIISGITYNNQTFVPLRGIIEHAGLGIDWHPGRIDIYKPTNIYTIKIIDTYKNAEGWQEVTFELIGYNVIYGGHLAGSKNQTNEWYRHKRLIDYPVGTYIGLIIEYGTVPTFKLVSTNGTIDTIALD